MREQTTELPSLRPGSDLFRSPIHKLALSAMSTPSTPSSPTPPDDNRTLAPVTAADAGLGLDERMGMFWEKNNKAIVAVLALVFLIIVGNGVWESLAAKRERDIEQAFAAATTPAQLKSFVAAHPDHLLAGVAQLRMADEAYAAGVFADAIAPYEQAAAILKEGPLASRARLGLAVAKLQGGRDAEGETALKALASNVSEIETYRAEAAYHLASRAAANNNAADVKTFSDQLMQMDPTSLWTQRALQLRASLPSDEAPADAAGDAAPAITLPGR